MTNPTNESAVKSIPGANAERINLQEHLRDAPQTPVTLATLRWLEVASDVDHHTKRLEKLRADKSDRTMVNFVGQRLASLRGESTAAAMRLADIPAKNARDIYCKLLAATQAAPNDSETANTLFALAVSARNDLDTFLGYVEARQAKQNRSAG